MSDDEIEPCDAGEQTRLLHERYYVAVNNTVRKAILQALRGGGLTIAEIQTKTNLTQEALSWHLSILENAGCIEKAGTQEASVYKLTQAGKVINYTE